MSTSVPPTGSPPVDDGRRSRPADIGERDVRGAAADVQDQRSTRYGQAAVIAVGGGRRFFEEFDGIEAGGVCGVGEYLQSLHAARLLHAAAEAHRPSHDRLAHLGAQLRGCGRADVAQQLRGDPQQSLASTAFEFVAQHGLGRNHQVAGPAGHVSLNRFVAVQRVLHVRARLHRLANLVGRPPPAHRNDGGTLYFVIRLPAYRRHQSQGLGAQVRRSLHGFLAQALYARQFLGLLALRAGDQRPHLLVQLLGQLELRDIGHPQREEHGRAELPVVAEADQLQLAVDHRAGGRVAGSEVDSDPHGRLVR